MKKLSRLISVACLSTASAFALEEGDRSVSSTLSYYGPSSSFFDSAYGLDFTYSFWRSHEKAIAVTAGIQNWELDKQTGVNVSGGRAVGASQDGSATLFPIGLSMIWRNPKEGSDRLDLGFQLGVQYVFATSDADQLTLIQTTGGQRTAGKSSIDIGSNLIGKAAIEIDYLLGEYLDFVFDFGYQMDFLKGDIKAGGRNLDEVELKGYFARAGFGYRF